MTIEQQIAALTTATTNLLDVVNVKKTTLDAAVSDASNAAIATAADRVQTGLDAAATAADRIQTGLDRTQTGEDRVATAADRVQTGEDRIATAADRVQTSLDAAAASASAAAAAINEINAANSASASATSANNSAGSAVQASTQANNAETSALAASSSANQAALSSTQAAAARQAAETAANNAVAVVTGGTASLTPEGGKIPIADAAGKIDPAWIRKTENDIGIAGQMGFGVGICPADILPSSYSEMVGTTILGHDNYGNYQFSDGSVEVWIPRCWFKIGMGLEANGLEVNKVLVQPADYFRSESDANAAGYMSHRADWDAGILQPGVMVDKYICSANGGIASSIKNASPMVSGPTTGQIGFSAVGATNQYHGAITAAKTRSANHFCSSRFIFAKLALLSLAHAQAAKSTVNCAWYDATGVINFPKGCNNNALRDVNDTSVLYTTAGASSYPAMPLTGSGLPFAKTTHNGQNCGIADLNGTVWEINLGFTCIATTKNITAITQSSPAQVTITAHGYETNDIVMISSVGGMTQLNNRMYKVTVIDANTFSLNDVDSTGFTTYTSGGTVTMGRFYASKKSTRMASYTPGTTLATDHWGATGVAATMDRVYPEFRTDYANNGFDRRFGNSVNQVLSGALAGNNWLLSGLGFPLTTGISTSGTNIFGQDYYYQYVRDQLCVQSGGNWNLTSYAGVWSAYLNFTRSRSHNAVGFRAASYLVG